MRRLRSQSIGLVLVVGMLMVLLCSSLSAQTLQLSKNADFSTSDALFSFSETLYAKVTAPHINYLELDKNEFRLEAGSGGHKVEGAFDNNLNGTYTAEILLAGLERSQSAWEFRAEIKDENGAEFKTEVGITIQAVPGTDDSLNFIGRIDSLGANSFRLSGTTIFVDNRTDIRDENGQPLPFNALQKNWKVEVDAERRNDNRIWALRIVVLERGSVFEVETRGLIASIQGAVVTVNNIAFIVTNATEIIDDDGRRITLAGLRIGMLVEAKGKRGGSGEVTATRIKVEEENPGGLEFELNGRITALFSDSTGTRKNFIDVNGTRFEVAANAEILGFENEPISFFDLRVGENVEVKARTRAGQVPLAERIKRQDRDGDEVEVHGTIVALGDSSLTVGQLVFQVAPTTVILDHENRFIKFSDLRTGMFVEVRANAAAGGALVATRIKVEDDDLDEVEVKGFIDALTENSLTVLGFKFLVDDSTVVLDRNNLRIPFADLRVGMLVEVRADKRFDGSLYATRIKIEDFLQDEIEIRGVIAAKGEASLEVAGIEFFVNAATAISDRDGNPIDFSQLTVGMVVEIRAHREGEIWLATRIRVEDQVHAIVEIRGRIDSIDATGFMILQQRVRVTATTVILDENNGVIPFGALRAGDFVEVRAQLLPDKTLAALRIKREDAAGDKTIEFSGSLNALSFTSITVGNIVCAVNAGTVYLDPNGRTIAITDLHLGMTVAVKARRESTGALVAELVQVEERRSLIGAVTEVSGDLVFVQGLRHTLVAGSLIYDATNRLTNAQALHANQQIQLVAKNENAQSEILTLRIISGGTTGAEEQNPTAPFAFELAQNYPNPFNPSTVIRYTLPQAGFARLAVYDVLGRRIRTLVEGMLPAGTHHVTWDSRDETGRPASSGIYFYRLEAQGFAQTRRLMLMQ